jgi:hypothetical protein
MEPKSIKTGKNRSFWGMVACATVLVFCLVAFGCDDGSGNGGDDGYAIGDTGHGGGIVFYDKGSYSDGWRYLEAAPASTEWTDKDWGAWSGTPSDPLENITWYTVGGTETGIGMGKGNTVKIVAKLAELGQSGKAAQLCVELSSGGKSDWFLPSKDELYAMYQHRDEIGGFTNTWYCSSSENENEELSIYIQHLGDGRQYVDPKVDKYRVRAARIF